MRRAVDFLRLLDRRRGGVAVKASEVEIGGVYVAKVSGKLARVNESLSPDRGGWKAQ